MDQMSVHRGSKIVGYNNLLIMLRLFARPSGDLSEQDFLCLIKLPKIKCGCWNRERSMSGLGVLGGRKSGTKHIP